jgi:dihydrofolate reductase
MARLTLDIALAGGASVVQQCIEAGLLDEMQIHLVPCSSVTASGSSINSARDGQNWKSREQSTHPPSPHISYHLTK